MARRLVATLAVAVVVALTSSGCADLRDQLDGASVEPDAADQVADVDGAPILDTVEWAVTDGLLSVIVRNPNDPTLRTAHATLTAYDADHRKLVTVGGDAMVTEAGCCTVVGLAPGDDYGLYFVVGDELGPKVADVDLAFSGISFASASAPAPTPITTTAAQAVLDPTRTTVTTTLQNGPAATPLAVVQAVLRGRSGRLIAVVTGRWTCLGAGERRPVVIELFQPVPPGTTVDTVTARPLTGPSSPHC